MFYILMTNDPILKSSCISNLSRPFPDRQRRQGDRLLLGGQVPGPDRRHRVRTDLDCQRPSRKFDQNV